jgi:hypothetical protein
MRPALLSLLDKRKTMNNQFDELTKGMAQSVTRRGALKKFGVGLAGIMVAAFGLPSRAARAKTQAFCQVAGHPFVTDVWFTGYCMDMNGCVLTASSNCPAYGTPAGSAVRNSKLKQACSSLYRADYKC